MTEGGMIAVISILSLCCIIEFVFMFVIAKDSQDYEKALRVICEEDSNGGE